MATSSFSCEQTAQTVERYILLGAPINFMLNRYDFKPIIYIQLFIEKTLLNMFFNLIFYFDIQILKIGNQLDHQYLLLLHDRLKK